MDKEKLYYQDTTRSESCLYYSRISNIVVIVEHKSLPTNGFKVVKIARVVIHNVLRPDSAGHKDADVLLVLRRYYRTVCKLVCVDCIQNVVKLIGIAIT